MIYLKTPFQLFKDGSLNNKGISETSYNPHACIDTETVKNNDIPTKNQHVRMTHQSFQPTSVFVQPQFTLAPLTGRSSSPQSATNKKTNMMPDRTFLNSGFLAFTFKPKT